MKSLIVPIAIVIGLIVFFIIVDHKEVSRYNDEVPEYGDAASVSTTNKTPAEEKSKSTAETIVETTKEKQLALASADNEAHNAKESPASTPIIATDKKGMGASPLQSVTNDAMPDLFQQEKITSSPVAIPVCTVEEAEILNTEAIKEAKRYEFSQMKMVFNDKLDNFVPISIDQDFEKKFKENGVIKTFSELSQKRIPQNWRIDLNSLKGDCDFHETENGYEVISRDDVILLYTPTSYVLNTTTGISIELTGKTSDTNIKIGIEELGMMRKGRTYIQELSGVFQEEYINCEISAIEHYDKVRLFLEIKGDVTIHSLRFFQKEIKGTTYLEGQIVERSKLPSPKESDYPNCRFTAYFKGNAIKRGDACPREMVFIIEGFENFINLNTATLKDSDIIECAILPFEKLPVEQQSTQQSDDLNMYLLENYYVLNIHKISKFRENALLPTTGTFFLDGNEEYISIFDRHINPSISLELQNSQNEAINTDLEKMNVLLKEYDPNKIAEINRAFTEEWKKEQKKDDYPNNRVESFIWRKIDDSFWCLPEEYTFLSEPDILTNETLDCFAGLKKVCESNGVQLIISLVPDSFVVSSRIINEQFRNVPDLQTATYVKQLSQIGIETLYSTDLIIDKYNKYPISYRYPKDVHPTNTPQDCLSDILADRLKRYNIKQHLDPTLFSERAIKFSERVPSYKSILFPDKWDILSVQQQERLTYMETFYNNLPIQRNPNGEILIVGNSYMQSPTQPNNPAMPMLLSHKLLISPDWYLIGGLGPFSEFLVQLLSNPSFFLYGKKCVVFQFGTNHLTKINKDNIMLNTSSYDHERLILNFKKHIYSFFPTSNIDNIQQYNSEYWDNLKNKTLIKVDMTGVTHFAFTFNDLILNSIDTQKSIVCIVPCVTVENGSCQMTINGISHPVFQSRQKAKLYNNAFELPPDTKEIMIDVKGRPGTVLAIKDIQIWQ